MYKIVSKKQIGPKIYSYEIYAYDIAKNAKAGQFIMFRIDDKGERVPLTIVGTNPEKGLVRIIFQEVGKSTIHLASLCEGEYIKDFLGPLGCPTKIEKYGTIVAIAGGLGAAEIFSVIKEFKKVKNRIITIIGARCKDLIILKDELKQESDSIIFTTNNGTYGMKGFVTDILKDVVSKEKIDIVYAIGPVFMMKAIAEFTKVKHIRTIVSLNPIMLDGIGMCGACRVTIDGITKFTCVDGPEFNAHSVDWDELASRLGLFRDLEKISLDNFNYDMRCKCHKK